MTATADYLACDLGASTGRALLGRFDGRTLTLQEVHRFPNQPVRLLDRLHWNTPGLLAEIKTGLARAWAQTPALEGVGIDTWGVDCALLSRSGELLGLPYHYRERRWAAGAAAVQRRIGRERLYARTGIQFLPFNTLYQLATTAAEEPWLLAAADRLLFTPDLLHYWLTGVQRSEYTIASTSQLLDARRRCWAADLLEALDIPARILPELIPPGTILGGLLPAVADEIGGPRRGAHQPLVIAPTCHDTAAAVAAVPARRGSNWAYISSGTWSLVGVEVAEPILTAEARDADFTNEGGVGGRIRFLKNVAGLWLVQECRRTWATEADEPSFAELTQMAATAPALRCFINPDDPRFLTPGDMPGRIREFCRETGQPVPDTRAAVIRCVLESLALRCRQVLDTIERLTQQTVEVVHVVGGGVRNELLTRFVANAAGKPIVAGPAEATAAGNILVQALARGRLSSLEELRQVVADSTALKRYDPEEQAAWDEAYPRFQRLACAERSTTGANG